jgi:hypothetical protein
MKVPNYYNVKPVLKKSVYDTEKLRLFKPIISSGMRQDYLRDYFGTCYFLAYDKEDAQDAFYQIVNTRLNISDGDSSYVDMDEVDVSNKIIEDVFDDFQKRGKSTFRGNIVYNAIR